jgi:predicted nucleotide-binding protein
MRTTTAVPFPIEVAPLEASRSVDAAIAWLNGRQDEFQFHLAPDSRALTEELMNRWPDTPEGVWAALRALRQSVRGHQPYTIAVMKTPLSSGGGEARLGAAYAVDEGLAVVSLDGWEAAGSKLGRPDQREHLQQAVVVYYLVRLTVRLLCGELREHADRPGCVFHTWSDQEALAQAVWDLTLCDSCQQEIAQVIAESAFAALKRLLESISPEALQPTMRVWIACSEKGREVADAFYTELEQRRADGYRLEPDYLESIFAPTALALESAARAVKAWDHAVLVLTADELQGPQERDGSPSEATGRPTSDAVFSLGFFMGTLGLHRTFMVHDEEQVPDLPSYVEGITKISYRRRQGGGVSVVTASQRIAKAIEQNLRQ